MWEIMSATVPTGRRPRDEQNKDSLYSYEYEHREIDRERETEASRKSEPFWGTFVEVGGVNHRPCGILKLGRWSIGTRGLGLFVFLSIPLAKNSSFSFLAYDGNGFPWTIQTC